MAALKCVNALDKVPQKLLLKYYTPNTVLLSTINSPKIKWISNTIAENWPLQILWQLFVHLRSINNCYQLIHYNYQELVPCLLWNPCAKGWWIWWCHLSFLPSNFCWSVDYYFLYFIGHPHTQFLRMKVRLHNHISLSNNLLILLLP